MILQGKRALVVRGGEEPGLSFARMLVAQGAYVVRQHQPGEAGGPEPADAGGPGSEAAGAGAAIPADLLEAEACHGLVTAAARVLGGPLDILILSLGQEVELPAAPWASSALAGWGRTLQLELTSAFLLAGSFISQLPAGHPAKLVLVVDGLAGQGDPRCLARSVAGAGRLALVQALARLASPPVSVNALALGASRPGSSSEAAGALRYLLESSSFVSGAVLPVDRGGYLRA